ncbi:MAG TPA: helical backbone metal receptor [Verrucomicrobiae bacterium]|nr:helical backbone metal receptor [Verrucomicrobiae bacterium]
MKRGRGVRAFAWGAAALMISAAALPARGGVIPAAAEPSAQAGKVAPETREVTDELGRRVRVPLEAKRVVSLAPSLTETIYALGLEDKLAGDTSYCDTPAAAKSKPHVGTPEAPNLEAIVALHPDLVLMAPINSYEAMNAIARLGIPVYGTEPRTVREMLSSTERIAELMGAAEHGKEMVAKLQGDLDALEVRLENLPPAHVLFVVWEDPLITIGQNTFIADALRWAGAETVIESDEDYPRIGMEEVVRVQPDWIVLSQDHMKDEDTSAAELRTRPVWKDLRAVELGQVTTASDDMERPSPEMVTAIEELARKLHPEAFAGGAGGKTGSGKTSAAGTSEAQR